MVLTKVLSLMVGDIPDAEEKLLLGEKSAVCTSKGSSVSVSPFGSVIRKNGLDGAHSAAGGVG